MAGFRNIVILGEKTREYLNSYISFMKKDGYIFDVKKNPLNNNIDKLTLNLSNFKDDPMEMNCYCVDISFDNAIRQLIDMKALLNSATDIINLFPVKCFPALRYNVDEKWENIDLWIPPVAYYNMIAPGEDHKPYITWVLMGIEKAGIVNKFFYGQPDGFNLHDFLNEIVSTGERAIKDFAEKFLKALGEDEFWNDIQGDRISFGFEPLHLPREQLIGEQDMAFWIKYSFSKFCNNSGVDHMSGENDKSYESGELL